MYREMDAGEGRSRDEGAGMSRFQFPRLLRPLTCAFHLFVQSTPAARRKYSWCSPPTRGISTIVPCRGGFTLRGSGASLNGQGRAGRRGL